MEQEDILASTAKKVQELHADAKGMMGYADHYAGAVKGIALTILGDIIWRREPDPIRIRSFADAPANMLWAESGNTYVFASNQDTEKNEIKDRTQTGAVLHSFDNNKPTAGIEPAFRAL